MLKIRQATLNDLEILLEFEQLLIDYERNLTSHIKDGKVLQEQDFFDNYTFLSQLGLL